LSAPGGISAHRQGLRFEGTKIEIFGLPPSESESEEARKMKRSDLIKNLRAYNKWRRGDETAAMPEPADIGRWIDQACDELRFLDAVLDGGVAREAGRCVPAEQLERERDEAVQRRAETILQCELLEKERGEAQATLSSIHRWIERNQADGFIDSLTYLQNMERVTDNWYDRLDKIERERDEARKEIEGWKNKWDCAVEMAARAENELDDAIKKIWRLEKQIEGSNNFANERFEEIQNVRKQRDKAAAERDDLRDRLNDILNQPALKSCKK
jgi:chromosome segregation ATPase